MKVERTIQFAYSFSMQQQTAGFVLGNYSSTENTHNSHILEALFVQVIEKVGNLEAVAVDAAYKTPAITNNLFVYKLTGPM